MMPSPLEDALVWDMVWPLEPWLDNDWAALERLADASYGVVSITLAGDNHNAGEALARTAAARRHILARPERFRLVETVDDIDAARETGRLAVALHFEGTRCFERNLDLVEAFYALGVRHTLLAFNQANSCGSGCAEADDGGLTRFGRSFIAEMNRVGMLLDLSHVGRRTSLDALAATAVPAVFTHSNCDAVHPHYRNVTDEQIRAVAAAGGLVGISGSSAYLGGAAPVTETLFRHLDHIVQLVGAQHAGLGLDIVFNASPLNAWMRGRPDEWPDTLDPAWPGVTYATPGQVGELADCMLRAGYGEDAARQILGLNYRRICGQVWR